MQFNNQSCYCCYCYLLHYRVKFSSRILAVQTLDGAVLNLTEDFKYLGSHIGSSEKDIQTRKALAWRALHSMKRVWRSSMHAELKKKLFVTTMEAILLYGCETLTLSARDESRLDGCYTRMLRMVMNITWMDKMTNEDLYGNLPRYQIRSGKEDFDLRGTVWDIAS